MRAFFFAVRWPSLRPLAWLALLLPAMAGAQPHTAAGLAPAASPNADQAPLAYTPLQARQPLPDADAPPADWRTAHQAVAAFPRGHADIVRWEAGQGAAPGAPATAHGHGGHKP